MFRLHGSLKELQGSLKDVDIGDLKKSWELREENPLYLPFKDDLTDNALADYINSLMDPGKVKILFIRESEGVYQFGSKKVYDKSEGDKILSKHNQI